MTEHCYLDTTLLVEALLKSCSRRRRAKAAIKKFSRSYLPVYAIKEFQGGALQTYIWLHNHLVDTKSIRRTYQVLIQNIRRPGRVTTSLEALQAGFERIIGSQLGSAQTSEETDRLQAEIVRLELRRLIHQAWGNRRKLTTEVVDELSCFPEDAPYFDEETGMIFPISKGCPKQNDCCYATALRKRTADLSALLTAIKDFKRPEDNRRRDALHTLKNSRPLDDKRCRDLGDAYFALHCPQGAKVLTSNVKDHVPLCEALGRAVQAYRWAEDQ